jgi:hypothetical protein
MRSIKFADLKRPDAPDVPRPAVLAAGSLSFRAGDALAAAQAEPVAPRPATAPPQPAPLPSAPLRSHKP